MRGSARRSAIRRRSAATVAARYQSWRAVLLLESLVFLALGCWLTWRARPTAPSSRRPARWGLLLPAAVAIIVLLVTQQENHPRVVLAAGLAGIALVIALVLPAAAADLAAVAVVALGLFSLIDVVTPPRGPVGYLAPGIADVK